MEEEAPLLEELQPLEHQAAPKKPAAIARHNEDNAA